MKSPWVPFPMLPDRPDRLHRLARRGWRRPTSDRRSKSKPVGTGPFIFEDYKPNELFKAKKNPNYWNKPYPYLDEVEFRPIPDALNRARRARRAATSTSSTPTNGQIIAEVPRRARTSRWRSTDNGETSYTLLHVTQVLPDGTSSPLTDQRVRCALANATTSRRSSTPSTPGVDKIANGPFSPSRSAT